MIWRRVMAANVWLVEATLGRLALWILDVLTRAKHPHLPPPPKPEPRMPPINRADVSCPLCADKPRMAGFCVGAKIIEGRVPEPIKGPHAIFECRRCGWGEVYDLDAEGRITWLAR